MGRKWVSPPGNLYCSTLVLVRGGDPPVHSLSFVTALAVHDVVGALLPNSQVMLKWPNDVLVEGGKISGVLLERSGERVIAGIGINLTSAPNLPDRKTCCIADFAAAPAPGACLDLLADAFAMRLDQWRTSGVAAILQQWQAAAHLIGTPLTVSQPDGALQNGTYAGLAQDGALLLRLDGGDTIAVHVGDIAIANTGEG